MDAVQQSKVILDDWDIIDAKDSSPTANKMSTFSQVPSQSFKSATLPLSEGKEISVDSPVKGSKISKAFSSALNLSPATPNHAELFSLISEVYRSVSHIRTLPSFDNTLYQEDIANIQSIRSTFEVANNALRKSVLSELVPRVASRKPELVLMLAHYLYTQNEQAKNLELLQALNTPLTLDKRSVAFSLGLFEESSELASDKKIHQLMVYLSKKNFTEAFTTILRDPNRIALSSWLTWIKEENYATPILDIDPKNPTLKFHIVFDILCSRNDGNQLFKFFRAQAANLPEEFVFECLNKLILTKRFDLASKILDSKGPALHDLALAFARQDFIETVKEAKKLDSSNESIKNALIQFFMNQKQFSCALSLAKTSKEVSIKQAVCCQLIQESQFDYAISLLKTLTDPISRRIVYSELISANQESLALSLSAELETLDTQVASINELIQAKQYKMALEAFKLLSCTQTKESLIQDIASRSESEENGIDVLIDIYVGEGKYDLAFETALLA